MSYWQTLIVNDGHKLNTVYLQILNYYSVHLDEPNHKHYTETNWHGYNTQGKWSTWAKQKNKKFPARNYRLTTGTRTTFFTDVGANVLWLKKEQTEW